MTGARTKPHELRARRRRGQHGCWDQLIVAPLWVAYGANLGTMLRTCDAIGSCLAVPRTAHYRDALQLGDTLRGRRPCIHWVAPTKEGWLEPARRSTVLLLGHEHLGVPDEVLATVDECVEIPMVGWGASLNVAVAGSLVAYRLAGLS